ncbi:membrane-bound metal-dependent hydrolase YbcI (DUF457 family) [Kineococcus radiotolerans]|uniref:Membrane-bound metal-dependent hydrolase YbcI (DUF457 family) n=1 Tax=Kineococcus radiotolerans TaxID=131568 RepID=A0A7W4TQN0_KINRA|nr:VanZ family protein [Kineococcus radiotolerans]MBB2903336.1 membrane-bound metal-dependent hydrolase YbcI (DUF457 family) [Kineococcus radiotolerans]
MLSTFLITHRWITPVLLAGYVVTGPLLGAWLVRRSRLAWVLAGLSLLPLAALTLVPVARDLTVTCAVQWSWPTPARVESFANLVLFVAPVALGGVATRRPVVAILAGAALSAAIEAFQAFVPALGRSCDTSDWSSNTLGAVVGGLLAWAALALARSSRSTVGTVH